MYVDLGAYGIPRKVLDKQPFDIVHENRAVEDFVHSRNGFQMLYADTYRTRAEFRAMFDHTHYDAMRERYGALEAFPEVFDKVKKRGFSLEKYEAAKAAKAAAAAAAGGGGGSGDAEVVDAKDYLWLIPIELGTDMQRVHSRAGFTTDGM